MRFKGLDLNLLGVFETLMRTRSVSRSAEELNLSQPALSSALKRLRDYFGDDILVAHGKRMLPTAYAESLLPQVLESLRAIESLIATSTRFDPATSQRTFRLCSSDYISTAVLAPLSRDLAREAPTVRLELLISEDQSFAQLEQGAIDLLITPEGYIDRSLPAEHLFDERHVIVGWRGNPLFAGPIDEAAFFAAGHVTVAIGYHRTPVFSDRALAMMGKQVRVEMVAPSFAVVPWLLMHTPRLALMHERLALVMAAHHPIAIAEIPFDFPTMRQMVQHHPARAGDPGLIWLRERLRDQGAINKKHQ
ncbi:DNA-binding transcriptional LysR family regulator [Sphingomonas vulcanisoli]|uniref:DNA-binding transcriptional LysR family regulator n=1 Tax=Sphingomonas vulcanisoli TaxID=1658060 RepID=A0ABX0TMK4_9SPHN|nr:LysR family transcriptional regulator [Sphingomonas vulcanisoli]NIJ06763.1 DNA-binding transcriptional LysR family regulator [Sphingomonas vulcanisoli]